MSPYRQFIDSLSEDDIGNITHGAVGIGCDDQRYRLVRSGIAPVVEPDTGFRSVPATMPCSELKRTEVLKLTLH
jgi:hypothetical protein